MRTYTDLAIKDVDSFIFGKSPHPLKTKSGLDIGGGTVYLELNFTLPPRDLILETRPGVKAHYNMMAKDEEQMVDQMLPQIDREKARLDQREIYK